MRKLALVVAAVFVACGGGLLAGPAWAGGCANEQLRAEQPFGLGLPDCRAFEVVSPAVKEDSGVEGHSGSRASVTGEAIMYSSRGAFAGSTVAEYVDSYVSRRRPGGWATQNITPPFSANQTVEVNPYQHLLFTPDLSKAFLGSDSRFPLSSGAAAGYPEAYVADIAEGTYQFVAQSSTPLHYNDGFPQPIGASTDLSHIVHNNNNGSGNIEEWVDGQVSFVNVSPNGTLISANPGSSSGGFGGLWRAVSDDGSRVFFNAGGVLYVRENPTSPTEDCSVPGDACTVAVSASQRAGSPSDFAAVYQGASIDGSRVFFTSHAELTDDAYTGSADNAANLYEYNLESGVLTDLTVDTTDADGAGVLGVVTVSKDGSYMYFVAEGALAGGAVSGQPNLYLSHDGATTFIATLRPPETIAELNNKLAACPISECRRLVEAEFISKVADSEDWTKGPGFNEARETPDGTHLAFISNRSLTGYDNEPVEPKCTENDKPAPGTCAEVYLYDALAGRLSCVSCNPSGARPLGPSNFRNGEGQNADSGNFYTPRNFSDDGSRLFFQSKDALVPGDSNGLQDVYEYEGGRLHLISNGAGGSESNFMDASPSGGDVFFATADRLVSGDGDDLVDMYDARVGGGFPVSVAAPVCDNGDSCKPPVSPQPGVFAAPASATFSGAGNLTPVPSAVAVKTKHAKPKAKKSKAKKKRSKAKRKARKAGGSARGGGAGGRQAGRGKGGK
jgi:hypothetical protein